jgi:hypothetical protein
MHIILHILLSDKRSELTLDELTLGQQRAPQDEEHEGCFHAFREV